MDKDKIDIVKLNRLLRSGKSQQGCAEYFGCSPSAISQAKKKLNINVVKDVQLRSAHKVVEYNLNVMDQLRKINDYANDLLDRIEDEPHTAIKICAEIRAQLRLQIDILESMHNFKMVAAFQEEVLDVINSVDGRLKDEIVSRLKQRRALRQSVGIH